MGKIGDENGSESQAPDRNGEPTTSGSCSGMFCEGCCAMGISRIAPCFSFKCLLVLILSLAGCISALFLLFPFHSLDSGYDASQTVKLSASIQAYFRLQKPVSQLVRHIRWLEYEIDREIGVPDTKVAIMSMHKSRIPNSTYVVFGILPDSKGVSINEVSLSVSKSSLIELFLHESNLNLTGSTFGVLASFQIIKFIGGITVIPRQPAPVSQIVQTLFSFSLNNSIYDVRENLDLLTKQLKTGLYLRFNENVYVQVTNKVGSTVDPPVVVQASVLSEMRSLQPERLKQLAQTIQKSSFSKNLGLNNTMFGRVKSVSLSSYLSHTLKPNSPSPSPSPSPSLEPSFPPCSPFPFRISASPSNNNSPSPCPNYDVHSPSPRGSLPPGPHCVSRSASPPSHYRLGPSDALDLSSHAAAQPPSGPYDDTSPIFQPFPFQHHVFMQGQEKSSSSSLLPRINLFSGTSLGIHLMLWIRHLY